MCGTYTPTALLILALSWPLTGLGQSTADSSLSNCLLDMNLVQAKVVEAKEGEISILYTAEVLHVYCGEDKLSGTKFSWTFWINYPELPLLKAGDVFISELWHDREKNEFGLSHPFNGFWWPAVERKDVHWPPTGEAKQYERAKAFAEAVEVIGRAKPSDRWDLLKKAAETQAPQGSSWAIRTIAETKPKWQDSFFHDLVLRGEFPVNGQIALDEVLSQKENPQLQDSEDRRNLIYYWVSVKLDDRDREMAMDRIRFLHENGELDHEILLYVVQGAVESRKLPDGEIAELLGFAQDCLQQAELEARTFELFMNQVREAKEPKTREAAAEGLRKSVLYYRGMINLVREMRDKTPDKNVAKILLQGLEAPIDERAFLTEFRGRTGQKAR